MPIKLQMDPTASNIRLAIKSIKTKKATKFSIKLMSEGKALICVRKNPQSNSSRWIITIPTVLLDAIIHWCHLVNGHCGKTRLYDTIHTHFSHPKLHKQIGKYNIDDCQRVKGLGKEYGKLPPRAARLMSWDEVAVDHIGPCNISFRTKTLNLMH